MKELLEKEFKKLKEGDLTSTGRVNVLNNIIQFKINEPEYANYENDLSVDIKRFFNSLVALAENGARDYDSIKDDQLSELLDNFTFEERIDYLEYYIRILEKSAFKNDLRTIQKLKHKLIITEGIKSPWKLRSLFNLLVHFPLYNIATMFFTLILIGLSASLILLPAPIESMEFLNAKIKTLPLSENATVNHFINVSSNLLGVNDSFKVTPKDVKTMVTIMTGKVFIFLYVIAFIFNKLTDLIKR